MTISKKYQNQLIYETSAYLLQHAHNPVNWYPWGEEALQKAIIEDKPILVSIGYSACHWCHVMEKESFENEEVASIMNNHFINIKIDREERPDLDQIYMDAVQAMSGSGGWPLNVFLTPSKKPFYGGTYFPPIKAHGRNSWTEVLLFVSNVFKNKRDEVEIQSQTLIQHIIKSNQFGLVNHKVDFDFNEYDLETINQNILKNADKTWGGFGNSPKFPQTGTIQVLLNHFYKTQNTESLHQAELSLMKMLQGGIYDHLLGGFARYSTDAEWLVPHFEKMLYDNALIIQVLSSAYSLTKNEIYFEIIHQTIQFVEEEWMNEDGGFFSAYDADSNGKEGEYYVWTKSEIDAILKEDSKLFCSIYDVTVQGNWENENILWLKSSIQTYAKENNLEINFLKNKIEQCKSKLVAIRNKRTKPLLDKKIQTSWNALMNIALTKAYASTGNEHYKALALKNIQFIEKNLIENNEVFHIKNTNQKKISGFLDDYAYLIQAYISLQEITGNQDFLIKALQFTNLVIQHFKEEESAFFFYTSKNQKDIIVQKKDVYDGATPSGNSIMAFNLFYLSIVLQNLEFKKQAEKMIYSIFKALKIHPTSFSYWSILLQNIVYENHEIVIVGKNYQEKLKQLLNVLLPFKIIQSNETELKEWPLLLGKTNLEDALIYVCKNSVCLEPINQVKDVTKLINS